MPKSRNRKGHSQKVKSRNIQIANVLKKEKKERQLLIEEIRKKQLEASANNVELAEVGDLGLENLVEVEDSNVEVNSVVEDLGISEII